jgi:tetratricopeptide (TPR) repeat protein
MLKIVAMLAALAFSASLPAQVNVPTNRAQALEGLAAADATRRADAVIWIASNGTYPDEAILRKRLADENPIVRELAEQGVWLLWGRSGDDKIDALMAKAAGEAQAGNLDAAIATYTEVIKRKPAFAEGWNKRATVLFVKRDFRRSLADCDEVIKRNPLHFRALAGYGLIYVQMNQPERALDYFKRALKINPNMQGVAQNIELLEQQGKAKRKNYI